MTDASRASTPVHLRKVADGAITAAERRLPREVPVAIVHNGSTHAVMMASPDDLEDFAVGFSITEGVIRDLSDIRSLEVVEHEQGFELRLWLAPDVAATVAARRRLIAGPTGCGLCGVESLEAACTPARRVRDGGRFPAEAIPEGFAAMEVHQTLGRATRATHAAGLYRPGDGLLAVREDVGRHNALDKLVGFAVRNGVSTADAITLITSRVSIEMVQKTAVLGTPVLAAVSAPTDLALRTASEAGITLVAVARGRDYEVFSRAERIAAETAFAGSAP